MASWYSRRRGVVLAAIFTVINLYISGGSPKFWHDQHSTGISKPGVNVIPDKIWQCFDPREISHPLRERLGESIASWITLNPDFSYTLVSDAGANDIVTKQYANRAYILSTFLKIKVPILRADLLRYMLIACEGGYYGDVDTTSIRSVVDWIPVRLREQTRFVAGIEYDQLNNRQPTHGFVEPLSFAQWSFAATRDHPIMMKVVEQVVEALHAYAKDQETTIDGIQIPDQTVGRITGPQIWTRAVLDGMSEATGTIVTWSNVTGIQQPQLFGDILVLPVNAFGTGQPHSGAAQDITDRTMVRHHWKMSWRHLNQDGSMRNEE